MIVSTEQAKVLFDLLVAGAKDLSDKDRLVMEVARLRGEIRVLKELLREADAVICVVESDDCDESESMFMLRAKIAEALAPNPTVGLF